MTRSDMWRSVEEVCRLDRWSTAQFPIRLQSVDHDVDGSFEPLSGLQVVLESLCHSARQQTVPSAFLLAGVYQEVQLRDLLRTRFGTDSLLDWPGLRYLRFVFTDAELTTAVAATLQGRHAPSPLPTRAELLRCLRDVTHWVDRQGQVAAGHADNCALVAQERLIFTTDMLDPEERVLRSHHNLLAYLDTCLRMSPATADRLDLAETLNSRVAEVCKTDGRVEHLKADARLHRSGIPDLRNLQAAFSEFEGAVLALSGLLGEIEAIVAPGHGE